jgi:hypothetical protein
VTLVFLPPQDSISAASLQRGTARVLLVMLRTHKKKNMNIIFFDDTLHLHVENCEQDEPLE